MNTVGDDGCMKYDVFISAKSEDYNLAKGVFRFLVDNGLSVFLANAELRKIGMSQYAEAIDMALDAAKHMIVVASCIDYIRSPFVHYEWSVFSNDLKSGYRSGNLLTILTDEVHLRELPPSLRHQQSYCIDTYQQEILGYLGKGEDEVFPVKQRLTSNGNKRARRAINLMLIVGMLIGFCSGIIVEIWRSRFTSSQVTSVPTDLLKAKEGETRRMEAIYERAQKQNVENKLDKALQPLVPVVDRHEMTE